MRHSTREVKWGWQLSLLQTNDYLYCNVALAKDGELPCIQVWYDLGELKAGLTVTPNHFALFFGFVHVVVQWGI